MKKKTAIVLFGATGDLAQKKLFRSLQRLYKSKVLSNMPIICVARRSISTEKFRLMVKKGLKDVKPVDKKKFLSKISYISSDFGATKLYDSLAKKLKGVNALFYLATPPEFFGVIARNLKKVSLTSKKSCWRRIVIEKPFGHDLESAHKLNKELTAVFDEEQIYRIDHYLGKDLIQNILVFRFTNSIFEHLWSNQFVDHVQISVCENFGIEERGRYYDKAGALRDVVQNHLLQILCLTAMEPPVSLDSDDIRDEKVKILRELEVMTPEYVRKNVVRGQYKGYRREKHVNRKSKTETFIALKTGVHNLRWAGVPFYLRTGKKLAKGFVQVDLVLKDIPCVLFCTVPGVTLTSNRITLNIQPEEGISVQFNTRKAGHGLNIDRRKLEFCAKCEFGRTSSRAYDYLLQEALEGNRTLFTRWDEAEHSWKFIDAISNVWKKSKAKIPVYDKKTMGPKGADKLIKKDKRQWIDGA